ncbi:MAG: hypothetical protein V3U75_13060 [Methylococcaceae bacterium]
MAKNTIVVKGFNEPVREEFVAAAVITPGHLIEQIAAGTVQAHAVAEGSAEKMFAVEDDHQGNDIDDNYSALDRVQCWIAQRGDLVYAWLANGETAVIGSKLSSNGDGALRVHVPDDSGGIQTEGIIAVATEAVDMSDSSGADPGGRIIVRVI